MRIKFIVPVVALFWLSACGADPINDDSLADQIVGTFVGMYTNPTTNDADYSITVTKISDTQVQFAPTTGTVSATFKANLTEETNGGIVSIKIVSPDDILATNGSFVALTGKITYSFHLGGNDDHNIEIFIGNKQ